MKYLSIKEEGLSEYREKGSKFLGFAASAVSEEDVKKFLARINEAHPKARHLCYAYRLDLEKKIYRANDDGEPSGTAGKPILGQIDSKGLSKVIVGVIRYFGGTKLGTAGLFNAYKVSASDAIDNAVVAEFEVRSYFLLSFDYPLMNEVMRMVKRFQCKIHEQFYDEKNKLRISISIDREEELRKDLSLLRELSVEFLHSA